MATRKTSRGAKVTPIHAPEPIIFPSATATNTTPAFTVIPQPDPETQALNKEQVDEIMRIEALVRHCVHRELKDIIREHDNKVARTLYKVVMDWPIAEIMTMGEGQFEALFRSVMEAQ